MLLFYRTKWNKIYREEEGKQQKKKELKHEEPWTPKTDSRAERTDFWRQVRA